MAKMWSGRFEGSADAEFESWQRSFTFDQRLLPYELAASRIYARALERTGVLSEDELRLLLHGIDDIERTFTLPIDDSDSEDVHHFVERKLVASVGPVALKLHAGRSRNEQIATDLRLYLRARSAQMQQSVHALCESLITQAENGGHAIMPAYTHLQRAEPVLLGHWLLAYFEMFVRDQSRIADAISRMNECPLGSGPIAGSTLPLDREGIARELGFAAPCTNSIDATADRDFVLEYVNALAQLGVHLSRLCEELILFASQEFGFVLLPDAFSTGSSAMPQKKNPDAFELIRAKCGTLLGCAQGIATIQKGLPLAYNKDLQEIQPLLFNACDVALGCTRIAAAAIRTLGFNGDRMLAAASTGYMNAMAAATYLVGKGVAFRTAHEQVGKAVRYCIEKGCELQDLALTELHRFAPEADGDFYSALTPDAVLDCHDVFGGTARHRVQDAVKAARSKLERVAEAAHAHA